MGKHNLDNLFEKKLANHELTPSASAWDDISTGLDKRKGVKLRGWLSVAAAVTLLMASAYLLIQSDSTSYDENYLVEIENKSIAPDVRTNEVQLPYFIKPTEINIAAESDAVLQVNSIKSPETKKELAKPSQLVVVVKEDLDNNNNSTESIMSSELDAINPVLLGASEEIQNEILNQPEEPELIASTRPLESQPVTIIYKQGEIKEQSRISKALNFMGEVGKRDKKLIDMGKIKTNLFGKNKEQVNNSK